MIFKELGFINALAKSQMFNNEQIRHNYLIYNSLAFLSCWVLPKKRCLQFAYE